MKQVICCLLLCSALHGGATNNSSENTDAIQKGPFVGGISAYGFEILLTKLNDIDRKLMLLEQLQLEIHHHRERTENNNASHEKTLTTKTPSPKLTSITSCKGAPANSSGVYLISDYNNNSAPFKVYCEMEKFEGGWTVVQHRFNGSVDFYRNWDEYREGFGQLDSEFWLGLERMHQLTTARPHELIVEIRDFEGNYGYARYSAFQVGSESEEYSLKTLGSYSGTAGDSMTDDNMGESFSTKDRQNNSDPAYRWAVDCAGGWWYGSLGGFANLNGRYQNATDMKSIWWYFFKTDMRGLSFTRMMIREKWE